MEGPNERIEDIEKARAMAEAGNDQRSMAAKARSEMEPKIGNRVTSVPGKEMLEDLERESDFWDKKAEKYEGAAGREFDIRKETENMDEAELVALADQAFHDKKEAFKKLIEAKDVAAESGQFMGPLYEVVDAADKEAIERSHRSFVLNMILIERSQRAES